MYDIPTSSSRRVADAAPPSRTQSPRANLASVPPPPGHGMTLLQFYDVPTNNAPAPFYDTPAKRGPTPQAACMEGVYDVPPQVSAAERLQVKQPSGACKGSWTVSVGGTVEVVAHCWVYQMARMGFVCRGQTELTCGELCLEKALLKADEAPMLGSLIAQRVQKVR